MNADNREREISLGAGFGFTLPALRAPVGWAVWDRGSRLLHARYLDTASGALHRQQFGLRHRGVDGETGTWTLKGPAERVDDADHRDEWEVEAADGSPPQLLINHLPPGVDVGELRTLVRLRTGRQTHDIVDADGQRRIEMVDDLVEVLDRSGHVADQFRELEVEFHASADAAVAADIAAQLRAAGATLPPPVSKLARALEVLRLDFPA